MVREPRVIFAKLSNGSNAEHITNVAADSPHNVGVYSIKRTAAGIYQFKFGTVGTYATAGNTPAVVDSYARLGHVGVTLSATGPAKFFVSNNQVNSATDPFVELTFENDAGTDTNVGANCFVRLELIDSTE
jgi:hypothetical protein